MKTKWATNKKSTTIVPEEKLICCATCKICKAEPVHACKYTNDCLLTEYDEPRTYYSWPRFRDDFGYLNWKPLIPVKTNHLAKELFEI